jgi:hypothetical protein
MALTNRFAAASAFAAAFSLAATPLSAAPLPRAAQGANAYDNTAENVQDHRWDRRGRHRGGIDGGDVLAGVLILGGIAAIASAASRRNDRQERYPQPAPYPGERQGYRYDDQRGDGRGIDRAVGMCVDEVERGRDRVDTVDNASRTGEGWMVSGSLEGGTGFSCRIDNDGRIRAIDLGGGRADFTPPADDRQWDDDYYARARAGLGSASPQDETPPDWVANRPEWQGDEGGADDDGPTDDGRYGTAQSPDFGQSG